MLKKTSAILAAALCVLPAFAADAVTDAMQNAYSPYRVALFKTNSNSQAEAQQAIEQARATWSRIVQLYGAQAPAPYDRDAKFSVSLAKVSKIYEKAANEISRNELAQAHETLEDVRDVMAELRRRNGVVVFSDYMNAYHAQMEKLLILGPKQLDTANGLQELTLQTGALDYLAGQLEIQAPEVFSAKQDFQSLLAALRHSVDELKAAILSQDKDKVKAAIGKLKAPYSKIFIQFG
ncbi:MULTISPECIES: cytochrome c [Comamonas]|uniref:cytochrome c n=1 Tax=Comamonas TaxID=283 RepID=UPI00211389C9|nr:MULTISPECIES: cytochrome c [Comamonas]UUC91650.1 cytochrome c [Comamonas sp. C11]WEE75556.1 cytochrome c [Comamonas testosteroni]